MKQNAFLRCFWTIKERVLADSTLKERKWQNSGITDSWPDFGRSHSAHQIAVINRKRFWSRCKNNEKAQRTCGSETIQNFTDCTGTSKRQTGEGRLNRMCVKSSLCNCDKTYIGETGRKFGVRLHEHRTEVESKTGRTFTTLCSKKKHVTTFSCIKFNRTQQIRSHRPRNSREPCHQLVSSDGDPQRARAFYQMDQRGHTHPKGRATGHEPWWGQLPTEPRIRPLSWHAVFPSCQEPEELITSFFWWRPLIEVET